MKAEKTRVGSILESATISKLKAIAVLPLLLALVSCATTGDEAQSAKVDWYSMTAVSVPLEGQVAEICRDSLGYEYPETQIVYRQGVSSRAWEIATRGKHGLILSRFEVGGGSIISSEVLKSREQRGRQVKSQRFLKQFSGVSLSGEGGLSRRIDSITGATESSRAVTDGAGLALRLDKALAQSLDSMEQD